MAEVLEKQKFSYLVIELDPTLVANLRARGIPCIYGDASNPEILSHAGLDKARVLICTIPDYVAEELTARNALKINPKLDIVARVHRDSRRRAAQGRRRYGAGAAVLRGEPGDDTAHAAPLRDEQYGDSVYFKQSAGRAGGGERGGKIAPSYIAHAY